MFRHRQEAWSQHEAHGATFHRFPSLPPELRLRIWHFAIQQTPAMINLKVGWKSSPYSNVHTKWRYLYASRPVPRPLLSVNCEARSAALSACLPGFYDRSGQFVVWINPKLDTLFVDGWLVELLVQYGIMKWIERVAFPVEDWLVLVKPRCPSVDRRVRVLCEEVPKLKEVQLVTWDEEKWSETAISWTHNIWKVTAADERARLQFARSFITCCGPAVGYFRKTLEMAMELRGPVSAQNEIVVRAISMGADSRWDHELRLM